MNYQNKLFSFKKLYNHKASDDIFIKAVKQNVLYHKKHCSEYAKILKSKRFHIKQLKNINDLYKLPAIPTLYLKLHKS